MSVEKERSNCFILYKVGKNYLKSHKMYNVCINEVIGFLVCILNDKVRS